MHARERFEMAVRLDAGSDDGERRGSLAREQARRHGRDGGSPRLGDVAAVEQRDQCAGCGIEQDDRRQVRVQPARGVRAEDGDELLAEGGMFAEVRAWLRTGRANEGGH